jgi:predicted metal-binding membrane protein
VDGAGLPRCERAVILAALAGVAALSWLHLAGMGDMTGTTRRAVPMFLMWWVMMIGMMLPSALPMTLTFATVNRRRRALGTPYVPTAVFVAGYVLAWGAFSVAATALQWGLERAALMTPMMRTSSPLLGGLLFVAAGLYQLTPLKHACLRRCRSPLAFVLERWHDGTAGALRMGAEHGAYCLGCCGLLMALLFVGGVMNLLWVAAIAAWVLVEKVLPYGAVMARAAGVSAIALGAWMIARAA